MQHRRYPTIGLLAMLAALLGGEPPPASALDFTAQKFRQDMLNEVRTTGIPDYNTTPNWANSPILRKFVDKLPNLCGAGTAGENNLGQCLPVAVPDTTTYPGSDYYEIELVQYREQLHTDLPKVILANGDKTDPGTTGGTLLRGYRQINAPAGSDALIPHYLGPFIVAKKDRPVRIKFVNSLPTTENGGKLFIPTDQTVMGAGPGPLADRTGEATDTEICADGPATCFAQNRADIHLHGGRSPWISDGTAHQWITPAGEVDPFDINGDPNPYHKGASVSYVPDMWYLNGELINMAVHGEDCQGKTVCTVPDATNDPGPGAQTYYFTNAQSARLMFYHDHSWGITRLNVYAGEAAGYIVTDPVEEDLITKKLIPGEANTIPLIIQDKTFVDATKIVDDLSTPAANDGTDPTWIWGSTPGKGIYGVTDPLVDNWATGAVPVTGDLWWPHVYMPAQNPFNPDFSGINPFGRWHYGPWFWPPVNAGANGPTANPYWDPIGNSTDFADQPPQIPATPNPSWGAEAFMDTPLVNGTAYPTLTVKAQPYRFRILNAAHDRFWNLQLYVADSRLSKRYQKRKTEVYMVPAKVTKGWPATWPTDMREGGVPSPTYRGPAMVQIMSEGGFLPEPVVLPNQPINWNVDPTTFTAGLVLQQNQGGGTLMLGPAERADVIVDFSKFAGRTLILYNDAPAPWPALDPHYDYYTGAPDNREMGGANTTLIGRGPNTRTIMQIKVGTGAKNGPAPIAARNAVPANLPALRAAFAGLDGVFAKGQEPIIVGQKAYDSVYGGSLPTATGNFPTSWPTWGVSRITDNQLSFMQPDGATISEYYMEPKAIQDEMGETFDEFGRMSAKLGLEVAFTNAGVQTFILQNFVDKPTEIVAKDQVQIWKITHNGVDTHPVHFHLFETQVINRVGWDGFIYLPDSNELGWKDTVRISPLQDTIVALRPAKVPVPFTVPNSIRPLNPAYKIGVPAGFSGLGVDENGTIINDNYNNQLFNFGHEYLWHCHILSHEEMDMMRPIVLNANSLLFTDNVADGFWQWNRELWKQISITDPDKIVADGTYAYAAVPGTGIFQWNGYANKLITSINDDTENGTEITVPALMATNGAHLFAVYTEEGLFEWKGTKMTSIPITPAVDPTVLLATKTSLFAAIPGVGLDEWDGTAWRATPISTDVPDALAYGGSTLYANFAGDVRILDGTTLSQSPLPSPLPSLTGLSGTSIVEEMVADGDYLYANVQDADAGVAGLWQFYKGAGTRLSPSKATMMTASNQIVYAVLDDGTPALEKWDGTAWVNIDNIDVGALPTSIDASGSVLYGNFPGVGVQKYEFNDWLPLGGAPATVPSEIVAGF